MKMSLSFLATDIAQMPMPGRYKNDAIEAVSFNRSSLEQHNWKLIWENVEKACIAYGAGNVTYHFPMNDSNYVEDRSVYEKLTEAYSRACNLGLNGMVIHSNQIKTFDEWTRLDIAKEQKRVIDSLESVTSLCGHSDTTWLGLENMPLVGNSGPDMDPLFCFSGDFKNLPTTIGVVWDLCHSTSTAEYVRAHDAGELTESLVLRTSTSNYYDFERISSKIKHWHFAGFRGLNDSANNQECLEGVVPRDSSLGEHVYASILRHVAHLGQIDSAVNFEIQEVDYQERVNGSETLEWAKKYLIK